MRGLKGTKEAALQLQLDACFCFNSASPLSLSLLLLLLQLNIPSVLCLQELPHLSLEACFCCHSTYEVAFVCAVPAGASPFEPGSSARPESNQAGLSAARLPTTRSIFCVQRMRLLILPLQELPHLSLEAVRGVKRTKEAALQLQLDSNTTKTVRVKCNSIVSDHLLYYHSLLAGAASSQPGGGPRPERHQGGLTAAAAGRRHQQDCARGGVQRCGECAEAGRGCARWTGKLRLC